MTERVERLRDATLAATPTISAERAWLMTEFYRESEGKHSTPVLRALAFRHLCEKKAIAIGADELIVGERGPAPKTTPTYPDLTCHSLDDLRILNDREKTSYGVPPGIADVYEKEIIPFWRGRSLRDVIFDALESEWKEAYEAGVYTEFMEQRAPGHTVADGKIYAKGMLAFKAEIAEALERLDPDDPRADHRREQLRAMEIAADAVVLFAERHAALAREMAADETDPARRAELATIAAACTRVPAHAPRNFHEALQAYWFCHLAVITELNGWDAFSPGHLDQHLGPFYDRGIADGSLARDDAKELLECFFARRTDEERRRRLERGQLPPPRSDRRDAHPPAEPERADLIQDARPVSQRGVPRHP